jgi:hypothetical protein
MTPLNTSRTYTRPNRPGLSLIKVGQKKTLFAMTVLNTNRTYKRPYWTWLSLIQIRHINDRIDQYFP